MQNKKPLKRVAMLVELPLIAASSWLALIDFLIVFICLSATPSNRLPKTNFRAISFLLNLSSNSLTVLADLVWSAFHLVAGINIVTVKAFYP